ncbi:phage tail protein [Escherichia coli]|uniref:phage tail protein n=1 Tax=Escherichia coli TaxID=562 RepID=UPI003F6585E6
MPFARYFCIFINVGLGEGSALPVGVPVPWPSATPPTGWLKCNSAAFSAEEYPELAKAYPTNKLPDLRGEFIRGWDDGRGVDSRRAVLSTQEPTVGTFYVELAIISGTLSGSGAKFTDSVGIGSTSSNITVSNGNDQSVSGTVAVNPVDTRPRNIAFNYIVRAA